MAEVVLITGCSSGLGRALAVRLHAQRDAASGEPAYRVYASARNLGSLKDLKADDISTVQLDVTQQESVDAAVKWVLQEAGRIDVLINNAGLSRVGPMVEQPLSEFQEVMDTNFMGVVRLTQAVAPHMMRQRSGLIVMIGSVVSMLATPFGSAYTASKAALLAMSDCLRLELQPFGVHLTYVTAGAIKSSLADKMLAGMDLARYERVDSLYCPLGDMISARARASQDPRAAISADAAADRIAAVINRSVLRRSGGGGWFAGWIGGGGSSSRAAGAAGSEQQQQQQRLVPAWRPRPPPIWFLAGGHAASFWLLGVIQKLFGWPVNSLLAKQFRLDKPID